MKTTYAVQIITSIVDDAATLMRSVCVQIMRLTATHCCHSTVSERFERLNGKFTAELLQFVQWFIPLLPWCWHRCCRSRRSLCVAEKVSRNGMSLRWNGVNSNSTCVRFRVRHSVAHDNRVDEPFSLRQKWVSAAACKTHKRIYVILCKFRLVSVYCKNFARFVVNEQSACEA